MKTLFLDFCSHTKVFAVVDDKTTLSIAEFAHQIDESSVMPAIEKLVKDAGLTLKDIERIAATTGPGGFMSQRVGLSVANTLSWSLKIPIGGVHLSDLWLSRLPHPDPLPVGEGGAKRRVRALWIHSTKRELLFVRDFNPSSKEWKEPTLISLDDLKASTKESDEYVGELIPEQEIVLPVMKAKSIKPLESVLPKICNEATYGNPPLLPWYGRGI